MAVVPLLWYRHAHPWSNGPPTTATVGLTPRTYLGGGAGDADHGMLGETDKLRESPKALGTALGW